MPKKNKRQARKEISAIKQPVLDKNGVAPVITPAKVSEFKPDYTHVIRDLRRIGILAGSFIVILIVLTFFLR